MNRILLFLICLFFFNNVFASHITGAHIRYEHNGGNSYTFYLYVDIGCTGGPGLQSTSDLTITPLSTGISSNLQLNLIAEDTINEYCGITNTCTDPFSASPWPGFVTGVYTGTTNIPPGDIYTVSFLIGARAGTLKNIYYASAANIYVEATLNTVGINNSSPMFPNLKNMRLAINQFEYVPFPSIDPDGDSIAYEFVTPQIDPVTPVLYEPNYNVTNPIDGTAKINLKNRNLEFMGHSTGVFALALKVKEYRNGLLIASYLKDFSVTVFNNSTGKRTHPRPTGNSVFSIKTCPGQNNSITLSFTDSTHTDSVYVRVEPPTIPGFNFTATNSNGIGAGSTTITWTTPAGFNPAALPQFYIYVHARDNNCPISVEATYAVLVKTQDCLADSVWPGDANSDKIVNVYDPLYIGIAAGKTGATRSGATINWVPQACGPWVNSFLSNNVDMKHADCDGNGTVNLADLNAVAANYNKVHQKASGQKTTGGSELYFDVSGITLTPGATVNIPIKLGDQTTTITDIYGLATRMTISGINYSMPAVSNMISWLDNSINAVNFVKSVAPNVIDWAISRTDHQNTSGQGTIGALSFTVPSNAKGGTMVELSFTGTKMIDKNGFEIADFSERGATLMVSFPEKVREVINGISNVLIIPNPSQGQALLQFALNRSGSVKVQVTDVAGKIMWQYTGKYPAGNQTVSLPANEITNGIYLIKVLDSDDSSSTLKWIKQ